MCVSVRGFQRRVVDAIQDARQRAGTQAQHAVHAHAVRGRLDLARVGRADGRDGIGEAQPGLQHRDPAPMKDAVDVEPFVREIERPGLARLERPLERQVVDGEQRRRAWRGHSRDIGGCQAGGPVVGVEDVGPPRRPGTLGGAEVGGDTTQEAESSGVVGVVDAGLVQIRAAGPAVQTGTVEQPELEPIDSASDTGAPQARALAPAKRWPDRLAPAGRGAHAYAGINTRTSQPRRPSAAGRAPLTSPRPPVLTHGAHSVVTKRTRIEGGNCARRNGAASGARGLGKVARAGRRRCRFR